MFVKTYKTYYINAYGEIKECFVTIGSKEKIKSKEIIKHLKVSKSDAKKHLKYLKS